MALPWLLGAVAIAASGSSDDDDREYERQLRREAREREAEARRERLEQAKRNAAIQMQSFTQKHGLHMNQNAAQDLQALQGLISGSSLDDRTIQRLSAAHAQSGPRIRAEDQRLQAIEALRVELNRAAQILNGLAQKGASRG